MKRPGTFYGVGVGPGDPELLTVKAVNVLKGADVIAVPRSSDSSADGLSQALQIAKRAVDLEGKDILELLFPMTKDWDALASARREAAAKVATELDSGRSVAFITLGDPMLYSTFSYLVPFVTELSPGAPVRVVPGITSFGAAASTVGAPLAEADEKVMIVPAAYDLGEVSGLLDSADTLVFMKVNRRFDRLLDLLVSKGLERKAFLVSRAGWPEERVVADIKKLRGVKLDYFSTLIVKKGGSTA
ncbi:MAG TPA: precorrin-2 C(20)-methyltransferase [Thermodesulfobacteriota bacterium]|nr:precorrin-2 C(20)-methyltransferase [Thermodesulfobacteriota bacterium]